MKKQIILVLYVLALFTYLPVKAQNHTINFVQNKTWKQLLKTATKEKKFIFIDCYTSWCGPCKMLVKNVFTNDSVANFYNKHFVNLKLDVEKDVLGQWIKKNYDVEVFPTLLFIDPKDESLQHAFTGYRTPERFIAGGKDALSPQKKLKALVSRYKLGERNIAFMSTYLTALHSAFKIKECDSIAENFLLDLSEKEWVTDSVWEFIKKHINNPLSEPLKHVMHNKKKYAALTNLEDVEKKITQSLQKAVRELTSWNETWGEPFRDSFNIALIDYLQHVYYPKAPELLIRLYVAQSIRNKDYKELLNLTQQSFRFNIYREFEFLKGNMEFLVQCEDNDVLQAAYTWLDNQFSPSDAPYLCDEICQIKQQIKGKIE